MYAYESGDFSFVSGYARRLQASNVEATAARMPLGDLPGWTQVYAEDFMQPAALGQIGTVYSANMRGYDGFNDTSGHGMYSPDLVLSTSGSILDYYLHTESGWPRVATPIPMGYSGQTYGRYSLRLRSDLLPGYKIAFLLWPSSDDWNEGEIDWPEGELGQTMRPASAMKGTYDGGSGTMQFDQATFVDTPTDTQDWHIATLDWMPGVVKFYWDGAYLSQTSLPSYVPTTNFRWTLQAETSISGPAPDPGVEGHLQVDWIVAYSYNGGTPAVTTPLAELVDDFSVRTKKWVLSGPNATQSAGQIHLGAESDYPRFSSASQYVFTGSSMYAKLTMPTGTDSSIQVYFGAEADKLNRVQFVYVPGYLTMRETVAGTNDDTTVAYDNVAHAWLRLRESGGTVYWEVSSDGSSWNVLRSKTTTIDFSEAVAAATAGNWNSLTGQGDLIIEHFNTP